MISKRRAIQSLKQPIPVEIEDLIFEWTARMHPSYAPTLSVVSKHVQGCVERIIYETLYILKDDSSLSRPDGARPSRIFPTLSSRPAIFFAKTVQNLFISKDVATNVSEVALSKCTGVQHLVFLKLRPQGAGRLISTSSVLSSLHVNRALLPEVLGAARGIELPNLSLLGIFCFDESTPPVVPSLHWLPALETVQINIGRYPVFQGYRTSLWRRDLSTILSTTPQLRFLWIDTIYTDSAIDVQKFINQTHIASHVEIGIRYTRHHWGKTFLDRWREIIVGNPIRDCKPSGDANYGDEKAVIWRCLDESWPSNHAWRADESWATD